MAKLAGQVAVVTGGSSGIGRATCLALACEGADVVVVGRSAERLAETARLVDEQQERHDTRVLPLTLDVRSEADMEQMAKRTLDAFGRIDILICSAGIARPGGKPLAPVTRTPLADFEEVVDTNLRGLFLSNRAVLPSMIERGAGDIVNVASTTALAGVALSAPYCASKFGVLGLSESLAEEVVEQGVRVQVVLPGGFETEIWNRPGPAMRWGGELPPPSRVAEVILLLLTLPRDTRLVAPVVQPLAVPVGRSILGGVGATKASHISAGKGEDLMTLASSSKNTGRLQGRVVIVTGGTGGIGLATCRAAAGEGASIVVADVSQERVDQAVAQLPRATEPPAGHLGVPTDVRLEGDNERLVRATLDRFGRIDALVACAGILRQRGTGPKPLLKTPTEEWDEVLAVNLKGVFLSNRAVLPTMINQRGGCIINISSVSGLKGRAHDAPYCASKFGVIGLTQSLADEVRTYGIKVTALMPDSIATPFWEQNHPIPPPGDALPPERVADLIVFMLAQPEDTLLLGSVIAPLGARKRKLGPQDGSPVGRISNPPIGKRED